jgi:hypothetical protein
MGKLEEIRNFTPIGNVAQCGVKDKNRNKVMFMFIETK